MKFIILLLSAVFIGVQTTENVDPKVVPQNVTANANNSTTAPANQTQVHPTVDTLNSALCKKCKCDGPTLVLDCSHLNLTEWFNKDELEILRYGDVKFEKIYLNNNELKSIQPFPTIPVKVLHFQHNQITQIEPLAFLELQFLEYLDLSYNQLTAEALTPNIFKGKYSASDYEPLSNLHILNFGSNDIHSLNPDLFEHLPNLENLTLSSNPFRVIDALTETAIASISKLKILDLSYMQLSVLPNYLLHTPRDLEVVHLTGNFLKVLPEAISHAINLKQLTLNENLFTEFSGEHIFPVLRKLETLHLSYCPELVKIGKGGFGNLENLHNLYMTNNPKLSYIHANSMCRQRKDTIFFDFPPLETLHLHNNNLTMLEGSLLERWDLLKIVDLRYNPWKCDCENDYVVNVLFTQIIKETPALVNNVNCSTPVAWKNVPIKTIHDKQTNLRCEDKYNNHPENDGRILVGMLIGLLVGVPLAFAMVFIYRRGCFGLIRRADPIHYNRAFYSQANGDDYQI